MAGGSQLTCTYQGCGGHHQPDKHVIYRLCLMTGSLSAQVLPQFYDLRTASHDCVHPLWLPRLDVWSTEEFVDNDGSPRMGTYYGGMVF